MSQERLEYLRKKKRLAELRRKKAAATSSGSGETAEDFARGVAQGATLGFHDELTGAVGAAIDPQGVRDVQKDVEALRQQAAAQDPNLVAQQMKAEGFSDEEIAGQLSDLARFQEKQGPSAYEFYRDTARGLQEKAEERSPIAAPLGEVGGALGLGALTGAASLPAITAESALYGLGSSSGSATDQLTDAATSGALGLGFGALGKGMGKLFDRAKNYLKGSAERQAVKAMNPTTGQVEKIYDPQRMGRALLDDGVVGPFRSPEKMEKIAKTQEKKLAQDLDKFYDAVGGPGIPREELAMKLVQRAEELNRSTANKPVVKKVLKFADDIASDQKKVLKPKDVRTERMDLDDTIDFASKAKNKKAALNIRDVLRRTEDEAFDTAGMGRDAIDLKRRYGDIADARKILKKTAARDKSGFSLRDMIFQSGLAGGAAGVGGYTQDPELAAALYFGTQGARKFGRGGAARFLDNLSKMQAPNMAPTLNRIVQTQNPYEF